MFDQHGAPIADKAIIALCARVAAATPGAVLGRTDYSAFAVLQSKVRTFDDPTRLAHRLILAATEPLLIDGIDLTRSVSIGIAVAPDDGTAGDTLLRRAETACERAKQDERNSVCFFDHEMDAHVQKRARIEQELRVAIPRNDVILHYQPIFSLVDERVIGFEALARWRSPKLGWVPPNVFVSIAEECGLMHELGTQLLRRACREAKAWPAGLTLAFNVSPRQSRDRALGLRILSVLDETGFDPRRLQVEISDRAVLEDGDAVRQGTEELARAGVQLALSGFGSGYATVSQLLQLRLDKIKIARSIVHRLGKDAESEVIVRGMMGMASSLGLGITAEGIETSEQLAKLTAAGCTEGQGFLFGKAVPPGDVQTVLRRVRRLNRNARPPVAPVRA
jgi:predicted signal transduction protein with EAL and GGDEF domain